MAVRQTISFLQQRLSEIGIEPDSRKGQNFLIDNNLQLLLVRAAELTSQDVVLEVGTGTGALTDLIAEQAAHVVTVEVDAHLYQLASEILIDRENVTMLQQDALKNKNRFDPRVLAEVQPRLAEGPGRRFKLVANLPYSVATPVLTNLLAAEPVPATMTATIQKELADRLVAQPSTKDYSSLSIWVQAQCRVEVVRVLPPSVFWPRPKVHSAIVQLALEEERRRQIPEPKYFHDFIRAMFIHRRKFLRSNLLAAFKRQFDKPAVDEIMQELGFDATTRAEELDVETMLHFCEHVRQRAPDWRLG